MPDYSIDAIKIAKAIQKNELSILDGKEFKMRDKIKKTDKTTNHSGDQTMKKPTLSQRLDELTRLMNSRFDNLEKDVKNINTRLDHVERRLDYNGLKDIPNS